MTRWAEKLFETVAVVYRIASEDKGRVVNMDIWGMRQETMPCLDLIGIVH